MSIDEEANLQRSTGRCHSVSCLWRKGKDCGVGLVGILSLSHRPNRRRLIPPSYHAARDDPRLSWSTHSCTYASFLPGPIPASHMSLHLDLIPLGDWPPIMFALRLHRLHDLHCFHTNSLSQWDKWQWLSLRDTGGILLLALSLAASQTNVSRLVDSRRRVGEQQELLDMGKAKTEYSKLEKGPPFWRSSRFGLAVICFFGTANVYAQRVNFSVGVVCMANHTYTGLLQSKDNGTQAKPIPCTSPWSPKAGAKEDGEFSWSKPDQGLLLGAFFWGYLVTQVPGGLLAERFGGKYVYLWFMTAAGVATLLTPLAARLHFGALIALRVVIGLGEGVCFASQHNIWSHWAPPLERSMLTSFSYAGAQIGNVVTFPFSGFLCRTLGWESIFYVFGGLGLLWCLAWGLIASNSPLENGRMSLAERDYIVTSLQGQMDSTSKKAVRTPWKAILTSMPVWAIVVANTTANFGVYIILTSLPTFLKEAMNFDIKSNGLFSAIPYLAYWLFINLGGWAADCLRKRGFFSTTNVRKLMMILALCGQAGFFVGTGYCGCGEELLAVAYLTLAQGISGLQYGGWTINHVDIAPRFAGTLFGLGNTFGTISGIVAPFVAAAMTTNGSREEWRSVFIVGAAILIFGAIFYAIFASGDIQPWAIPQEGVQPSAVQLLPLSNPTVQSLLSSPEQNNSPQEAKDEQLYLPAEAVADSNITFGKVTKFSG